MADTASQGEAFIGTILLEASVFFSLPAWMLISYHAWPANDPYEFGLAVLLGATLALVLCHVTPAICARRLPGITNNRFGRLALLPIAAWLCAGAAISLGQISQVAGDLLTSWVDIPHRGTAATTTMIALGVLSVTLAWVGTARQRILAEVFCGLGLGLLAGLLFWQWDGLWARNSYLTSEEPLSGVPARVIGSMLAAAVPASVLAVRIGRLGVSTRKIWGSGLAGLWMPLVASATLASLAKMAGTRLHWRPSLFIEFVPWAMVGPQDTRLLQTVWALAGLTALAPAVICAMWIRDLTQAWTWKWKGATVAVALGGLALTFGLTSHTFDTIYPPSWSGSVLAGSCLLGLFCVVFGRRPGGARE
jgi:hypothetical protein